MSDNPHQSRHSDQPGGRAPTATTADLRAEIEAMQREVEQLRRSVAAAGASPPAPPDVSSRRHLLRLAGASAVGALGATVAAGGRPAAAADPNDVVKNQANTVTSSTSLRGSFPGTVFGVFNNQIGGDTSALYAFTHSAGDPTIRADNDEADGPGGVAVGGNAPGGRDFHAFGSGRIAMADHVFSGVNQYGAGEIHQSAGTLFAMVSPTARRVVAGPNTAGALVAVDPTRVYDSRVGEPEFGRLSAGQSRVVSVANGRSIETGTVTVPGLVPNDATALVFTVTAIDTVGPGFLFVSPAPTTTITASTINWVQAGETVANSSMVRLVGGPAVRVHCGGLGSADVAIDVIGYHR